MTTFNAYVMPIIGAGTKLDQRRPKYVTTFQDFNWGMWDYGNEPWCLVGVLDISVAVDSSLTANADVFGLPQALDQPIGSAANTVSNKLEAVNIPGTWVSAQNNWIDVVRFVGAVCQFAQRFQGMTGGLWFTGGITLSSTFGSLPVNARNGIINDALSWEPPMDTSGITASITLRQIIRSAGVQYLTTQLPLFIAGTQI